MLLPWHRELDRLVESRLSDRKYCSTMQGIAPFYSDKYQKKTILAGELFDRDALRERLKGILEWKNLTLTGVYGAEPYTMEQMEEWLDRYGEAIKPYICDTAALLEEEQKAGKSILFEAQLGALRDIDFGIWPYITSSNAIAAYAPVGSGLTGAKLDEVVGVAKAGEYGAKTGRPRRVGPLDLVATRYGVKVQGATALALTKLDVLSYMDQIPVCVRYLVDGNETDRFPFPSRLASAEPVIQYVPGWKRDLTGIRRWEDLPEETRAYGEYVEKEVGCPIRYVSVGPERDACIERN